MKIPQLPFRILMLLMGLISLEISAQQDGITLQQDPKFDQMLAEKRRINPSLSVGDRYKIQIFNGDSETSKKMLTAFKNEFKDQDATIIFSTPSYKVWIGSFKSRIEAERTLNTLRKKYPNAIIIKPNR